MFDLTIHNGSAVFFDPDEIVPNVSIGISQGKIQKITKAEPLQGKKEIDASGKIISPGFIDFHSHVDGKRFSAEHVLRQGTTTTIGGERNFDGKTIRKISESGFLIHHGFYVSHSFTLRRAAGIKSPYAKATARDVKEMCMLAENFLRSGSFGIHFGLEFVSGTSGEEIMALALLAKQYGKPVLIHLRKDGFEALESIDEIIEIAEKTKASIHILHLMYMVGFEGIMEKALEKIDRARADGLDITADTGLYAAFPTCIGSSILDEGWEKYYGNQISEKNLMISSGIYAGQFCTKKMFQFLREEFPNTLITAFVCDEREIERALQKSYVYVSTNAADGPHYENMGHPETSGTFPKLIGTYVRDKNILPLTLGIRKITKDPTIRFGIQNKGELKEGFDADLVIFDFENIKTCSDYVGYGDPNKPPDGIEMVIINGQIVLNQGQLTGILNAGQMLNK